MERVKGIEPSYSAWEAGALPLCYTRENAVKYYGLSELSSPVFKFFLKNNFPQLIFPEAQSILQIKNIETADENFSCVSRRDPAEWTNSIMRTEAGACAVLLLRVSRRKGGAG